MDRQVEQLFESTMDSYRAALVAMGKCGVQACPPLGEDLQQSLWSLQERLAADATPTVLTDTEQQVGEELQQFGQRASEYYKQKANEVREIMTIMARTAQAISDRDQRYVRQFNEFSVRLQGIADLEDLTKIRESLAQQTIELKSSVDQMAKDGQQSVAQLRAELSDYQNRLEEAEKLASLDELTGLHNRRRVERQIELRVEQGRSFCVIIFDLNGFKQINDVHGHLAGDELLKQFATELRTHFAQLLGLPVEELTQGRMSYHLRRLRLHGMIERIPKSHRYRLTDFGLRTALFCTRAWARVFRTGLGMILPSASPVPTPLRTSFDLVRREIDTWVDRAKLAA